jgi:hypothetical protein
LAKVEVHHKMAACSEVPGDALCGLYLVMVPLSVPKGKRMACETFVARHRHCGGRIKTSGKKDDRFLLFPTTHSSRDSRALPAVMSNPGAVESIAAPGRL